MSRAFTKKLNNLHFIQSFFVLSGHLFAQNDVLVDIYQKYPGEQRQMKGKMRFFSAKDIVLTVTGAIILAFGMCNIHAISDITEGGTLGATLLIYHHFGISPAASTIVLNLLCYVLGARVLGKRFILSSLVATATYSGAYAIFDIFSPVLPQIASYPLVCSIAGAIFVGCGIGLCVLGKGAPSGDDALGMSLSKVFKINIKYIYLISDLIVLTLSLTYIPIGRILYSLLSVVLSGQIIGYMSLLGDRTEK